MKCEIIKKGEKNFRLEIDGKDAGLSFPHEAAAKRRLYRMLDPNRQPVAPVKASAK